MQVLGSLSILAVMVASALAGGSKIQTKATRVNVTVTSEVTMDITVKNYGDTDLHGTLRIALFGENVPMTALNFFSICNGVKRPSGELKFTNTYCHRLIKDMNFQCGDITTGDGTGGISMFGDTFHDENFDIGLSEKGTIAMANRGPNTNGSQFFFLIRSWQHLDGYHVAFGQVIGKESLDLLDKINEIEVEDDHITPKRRIKIVNCEAKEVKKYKIQRRASVKDDRFE